MREDNVIGRERGSQPMCQKVLGHVH